MEHGDPQHQAGDAAEKHLQAGVIELQPLGSESARERRGDDRSTVQKQTDESHYFPIALFPVARSTAYLPNNCKLHETSTYVARPYHAQGEQCLIADFGPHHPLEEDEKDRRNQDGGCDGHPGDL